MFKRMIAALLVALAVGGCSTQPAIPTSQSNEPTAAIDTAPIAADWRRDWLRGVPCAPPCILGITPGTLSQTATVDLLTQTVPDIQVEVLKKPNVSQGAIRWLADENDPESSVSALFYQTPLKQYTVPLNTVLAVRLGDKSMLPLEEVIAAYGEPSHVLAIAQPSTPGRTLFVVAFVYLEHGFTMTMDFQYDGEQPILEPSMMVNRVHFFPPGVAGFEGAIGPAMPVPEIGALLVPWEGFVPFEEYCREIPNPKEPGRVGCP